MRARASVTALAVCGALLVLAAGRASAGVGDQWALQYLRAQQCWAISRGSGVTVAVVDNGVRPVGDVAGQVVPGADFSFSATSAGDGWSDTNGHGTAIATDIAGTGARSGVDGLAPGVRILPIKVDVSSSYEIPDLGVAIRWAVDHGAQVVDVPLVTAGPSPGEASAMQYASAHDVVVVAAAGNFGADDLEYPAADSGVIGVSAIQQNGTFSSASNHGTHVVLAAPGAHILTDEVLGPPWTGYDDDTGDASAYVSAAAALVRAQHPNWTAGQVIRDLIGTADEPSGQTGRSDRYGYGIVDPLKALQAAAPTQTSNPLVVAVAPATLAATAASSAPAASSNAGLIIGTVVAAVVVLGAVVTLLTRRRRRA